MAGWEPACRAQGWAPMFDSSLVWRQESPRSRRPHNVCLGPWRGAPCRGSALGPPASQYHWRSEISGFAFQALLGGHKVLKTIINESRDNCTITAPVVERKQKNQHLWQDSGVYHQSWNRYHWKQILHTRNISVIKPYGNFALKITCISLSCTMGEPRTLAVNVVGAL